MRSLKPISVNRLHAVVIDELESKILSGEYAQGAKLPSEQQISEMLGVGRRAVREALRMLQAKGLVDIQMGKATTVARNDLDNFLDVLTSNVGSYLSNNRADIHHIAEFRSIIEGAAASHIIAVKDEEAVAILKDALQTQSRAFEMGDAQLYSQGHFEFHCSLVGSMSNPVIDMLYRQVLAIVQRPMQMTGRDLRVMEDAIRDHTEFLQAVATGENELAQSLLRHHLAVFSSRLSDAELDTSAPKPNVQGATAT